MSGPNRQRIAMSSTRQLLRAYDGLVRVREQAYRTTAGVQSGRALALFHATDDRTGLLYNWVVWQNTSTGKVFIREYADAWLSDSLGGHQRDALWVAGRQPSPQDISCCVVNGQVVFGSPGFPTMHGYLGGPIMPMTRGTSVNTDATTLAIPQGHVASWASRLVISDGQTLYFSDGLTPRAFVPGNITNPAADVIHGLSVNNAGDLIVQCSDGVYSLARHAAARQIVAGVFSKIADHYIPAAGLGVTHKGRLWVLDREGLRLADVPNGPVIRLNDADVADGQRVRIACDDWRYGTRVFSVRNGIAVVRSQPECVILVDLDRGGEKWAMNFAWAGSIVGFSPHHIYGDVFTVQSSSTQYRHSALFGDTSVLTVDAGLRSSDHPIGGSVRVRVAPEDAASISEIHAGTSCIANSNMTANVNGEASVGSTATPASGTGYTHNTSGGQVKPRTMRSLSARTRTVGPDLHASVVLPAARPFDEVDDEVSVDVVVLDGREGA